MKRAIVLFFVAAAYLPSSDAQDNKIPSSDLPSRYQPMYFVPGTTDFWPHNEGGYLLFQDKKNIELFCETGFRFPSTAEKKLTMTYNGGTNLKRSNGEEYKFKDIRCNREPEVRAREQGTTDRGYKIVDIGYQVADKFKSIYQLCFDYGEMVAKYAKYTLMPGVLQRKRSSGQSFQDIESFGPYRFQPFYDNIPKEFNRGHLAADADFFYGAEQMATYVYPNVSPQSKSFNAHEWSEMERLIRSNQHNRIFECYTGVLGVLPYGSEAEFYLDKEGKKIPAPKLFFRVVYEPSTGRGVVFVGVNDRFGNGKPAPICTNVIDQLQGIIFKKPSNPYFYACEYHEFKQKFPYLPALTVTDLLFKERMTA